MRRPVSGPQVMAEQPDQLAEVSGLPNVSCGWPHSALGRILECRARSSSSGSPVNGDGRESEPATVYKDRYTGALYLDKPQEMERVRAGVRSHEELARERLARSRSVTEFRDTVAPDPPKGVWMRGRPAGYGRP